jgi:hypothetical protein
MKTRKEQVQKVCADWHGGQWSALYQFASSGIYLPTKHLYYLKELQECREPEYYLHPTVLAKRENDRLQAAQNYFVSEGKKHSIVTDWKRHKVYGYEIPFVFDADPTVFANIEPLYIVQ